MRYFIIALSLLMAPLEAQNLTQFQNGQVADAVAINDNFESIVDAIEDLQQGGRLLSGEGDPGVLVGSEGDLYLNTATLELWGPLTEGQWPSIASLKGSSCKVAEENGGIYVRCSDGTEAELSAPPAVQNPTIGTFSMGGQKIDLFGFEQSLERPHLNGSVNGPVAYSTMTLQYDTSSFIRFDVFANRDLSGATIELSGGTAMTIDLQSFSVVSRSVVVGPDGTSLTELALITSQFEWTSPTSSLAVNQPRATSETACAMPTTFSRKGEKSSEEAIDDVIWGEDLGGVQIFGSPMSFGLYNFPEITVSHRDLERLPCFFNAFSPRISVMTIQLDAAFTMLELGEAYLTAVTITAKDGKQGMVSSWGFATRTETFEGTSYCWDLETAAPC